jgi:hypothetical protein
LIINTKIKAEAFMDELKQREEELFKSAKKKALTVEKSKTGYMIVDYYTERILAGHDYSLTLEDAEKYVSGAAK